MTEQKKFEQLAIVNLFGHQKMGALVSEQEVGGVSFVRVDIPETPKGQGYTRLLGQGAIYSIDFCSEEVARAAAEYSVVRPVSQWELPKPRLPAPLDEDQRDGDSQWN